MTENENNVGGDYETKPKLTNSQIIDLKMELIEEYLIDEVATAYALETFHSIPAESSEQNMVASIKYLDHVRRLSSLMFSYNAL